MKPPEVNISLRKSGMRPPFPQPPPGRAGCASVHLASPHHRIGGSPMFQTMERLRPRECSGGGCAVLEEHRPILLVEDDFDVRDALVEILESEGRQVVGA